MRKRWLVDLTNAERSDLEALTRRGNAPARKITHARVLLLADDGLTDEEIAAATGRSGSLVERTRRRFVQKAIRRGPLSASLATIHSAASVGSSGVRRTSPKR
jgi:Homeodomain-like domain